MFRRNIPLTLLLLTTSAALAQNTSQPAERWWKHVQVLAADDMEGRGTGQPGYRRAADYVISELKRLGLEPGNRGSFEQMVEFNVREADEEDSSLALVRDGQAEPLHIADDALISMRVDPAATVEAPLVFVGYGLSIPEAGHDDLKGLKLKGKIAVVLSGAPKGIPGALASHMASTRERWQALKRKGAIGLVTISNPRTMDSPWERVALNRFMPSLSLADATLNETAGQQISVSVNPARADKLLAGSGYTFQQLTEMADRGEPLPRFPLKVSLRAKAAVKRSRVSSPNIIAVLPGSDPKLKNEYVVLSAHLDGLGLGAPIKGDKIYNGAMDNASGTATLLEVAERLRTSNTPPRRSLIFLFVTGEEKGLLGSRFYAVYPTVPARQIVANVNVDMFLPLNPLKSVTVYGLEESDLATDANRAAERLGLSVQTDPEPRRNSFIRSDQYNFIRRGIPAVALKVGFQRDSDEHKRTTTWLRERYHSTIDDLEQPVDFAAAHGFNDFYLELVKEVANRETRPSWNRNSFFRRFEKKAR